MRLLDLLETVTVKDAVAAAALGGLGYTVYSLYQVVKTIAHVHPSPEGYSVRSDTDRDYEKYAFGFTRRDS